MKLSTDASLCWSTNHIRGADSIGALKAAVHREWRPAVRLTRPQGQVALEGCGALKLENSCIGPQAASLKPQQRAVRRAIASTRGDGPTTPKRI